MINIEPKKAISLISECLNHIDAIRNTNEESKEFIQWKEETRRKIKYIFGDKHENVLSFININYEPGVYFPGMPEARYIKEFNEGLDHAESLLKAIISEIKLYEEEDKEETEKTKMSGPTIKIVKDYVFIIMPMKKDELVLEDVHNTIKRICKELKYNAQRVDDIEHTGRITDKIIECIESAEIIIADLTYERPNVYYEIGRAHGLGKQVVLIAREKTELHFDIKDFNVIYYKNITELEDKLKKRLLEM